MKLVLIAIFVMATTILTTQQVYATGGGEQIAQLINPMLDRAIAALEAGNIELALEELETVKNELKDTFEVEE